MHSAPSTRTAHSHFSHTHTQTGVLCSPQLQRLLYFFHVTVHCCKALRQSPGQACNSCHCLSNTTQKTKHQPTQVLDPTLAQGTFRVRVQSSTSDGGWLAPLPLCDREKGGRGRGTSARSEEPSPRNACALVPAGLAVRADDPSYFFFFIKDH